MRIVAGAIPFLCLSLAACEATAQCGWQPGLEAAGTNGSVYVVHPWDPDGPDGPAEELVIMGGVFAVAGSLETAHIAAWRPSDRSWIALGEGLGFRDSWHGVSSVATLPDGRIVAGGGFRVTDGAPANYVAQWDGVEWSSIGSPLNDSVLALAVTPDGRLIAGGRFLLPSQDGFTSIAVLEGDTWVPLCADEWDGTFGLVTNLAVLPDGRIVAVGSYYNENQEVWAPIAIWDGTGWSYMGMVGGTIYALSASADGRVAICGSYLGPEPIAIWEDGTWRYVKRPYCASDTRAIAFLPTGELIADSSMNGSCNIASAATHIWDGNAWTMLGRGRARGTYASDITCMRDGRIVVARETPEIWDGTRWLPFGRGIGGAVRDVMAKPGGGVYVAGSFDWIADQSAMGIARSTESGWQPLGDAFSPGGSATSLLLTENDTLLAAGNYFHESVYGTTAIGAWNGFTWSFMTAPPGAWGIGQLYRYADGSLGALRSVPYRSTGDSWVQFPTGFSGPVSEIEVLRSGEMVFTGLFSTPANRIVKWGEVGWETLGTGLANGHGYCLLEHSTGDIFVGGSFQTAGGITTSYIARWDGTQWHDLAGGMSLHATVSALIELPNGDIVAGGTFTSAGGVEANNIARWDGTQWHSLGGGTNGHVKSLEVLEDGSLAIGGMFTHVDGEPSAYYARYVFEGGAPQITEEPRDVFACVSAPAELHVEAAPATGLVYQWQIRDLASPEEWDNLEDGPVTVASRVVGEVSGTATDQLSFTPVVESLAIEVRCLLSNACGSTPSISASITACRADITCDGVLDTTDALDFLDAFFACEGENVGCTLEGVDPNFNADSVIDILDLLDYFSAFANGC